MKLAAYGLLIGLGVFIIVFVVVIVIIYLLIKHSGSLLHTFDTDLGNKKETSKQNKKHSKCVKRADKPGTSSKKRNSKIAQCNSQYPKAAPTPT